ncbi:anhydro-N-acetylmuramic acid kinase [Wukongibacter baidiensis]
MLKERKLAIGLMSGTSLDGVDACLVEIKGCGAGTIVNLIDFISEEYSPEEKKGILMLCSPDTSNVEDICRINIELGRKFGNTAKRLMEKNNLKASDVDFISSHGQTIYHMPEAGATLQIGELAEISSITGCLTIGDYRPSDMSVGGQGAPLVTYTDYILFTSSEKGRVLINIGGISNLTALRANSSEDDVLAFDCGPGNMLIDRVVSILTDNKQTFDQDGNIALKGKVNHKLLDLLIKRDDFVLASPPKSTGREQYNEDMVKELLSLKEKFEISFEDFVATITAYTYTAVADNIKKFVSPRMTIDEIYVGGGGAKNNAILKGLSDSLNLDVCTMEQLSFSSDAKEAIAFAILGNEFLNGKSNNLKSATGARKSAIMGKLVYPPCL